MKQNKDILPPTIHPEKETRKIVKFLKNVFKNTGFKKAVLGLSGGIDSMTSLYLLKEAVEPEHIIISHMFYEKNYSSELEPILRKLKIPKKNIHFLSIKKQVDSIAEELNVNTNPDIIKIRIGNISARVRMIFLYDLAKSYNALVCGTENKSEYHLGYFTRFGDQASDFEPIQHVYKTQVYTLAKYLNVPGSIQNRTPSADLWHGQTDEDELGFTYAEADIVLYNHFDRGVPLQVLEKQGYKNARKILKHCEQNHFKHTPPYIIP